MDIIEYTPSMGEINLTDEMISELKGLPIEEQAKLFGIVYDEDEEDFSYGESDGTKHYSRTTDAENCRYARKWIVKDGIIVGIVFSNWNNKLVNHFLESWCNVYFCVDEDGTGSTDVSVYCKLVWKGK